jgi:integrase/recombinase XerC
MLTKLEVSTDWQTDFTDWMRAKGKGRRTISGYIQGLRVFGRWYQQENRQAFDPAYLASWDVVAFRVYSLEVQKVKPNTWNNRRHALIALAKWARDAGLISTDPMLGTPAAALVLGAPHWLDHSDFYKLMRQFEIEYNAANTSQRKDRALRDAAIVSLMVFAGLRVGEVVMLRQADVELSDRSGRVTVRLGKREKYRQIPINKEARKTLADWLAIQPSDPNRLLFGELSIRSVELRVKEIARAAGVDCTPHQLRHTCAKRILDAGRPLTEVQQILGHTSLTTTARYVTPGWEDLQLAVDSITVGRR